MTLEEFDVQLMAIKNGPTAKRPIFVWTGTKTELEELIKGLDIHYEDMVLSLSSKNNSLSDHPKIIQSYLNKMCRTYQESRQEPSIMIIDNAILLARYACDLSVLFKFVVSPRSAVVLIFPQESRRDFPIRTET